MTTIPILNPLSLAIENLKEWHIQVPIIMKAFKYHMTLGRLKYWARTAAFAKEDRLLDFCFFQFRYRPKKQQIINARDGRLMSTCDK
ncbi:hypothetical protein O9G_004078 [Rozella allomycis CSF55]|uniref:Uncharacterized protein n=1 Tax=Rozella allomycis (strain CSF55) TaxID=988480 RepID=A0A075AXN1_ROZAC|nr:hypothetical protein O9G_004078 [Rozella allomycis CSF55]|eukprot:EPZ35060.1 hypothetical protein O9G_004078 [Rozella allomycis CSF55]